MSTIDQFILARTPYLPTDVFGIGYDPAPTPTRKGTLADLTTYLLTKSGTGQITPIGNTNYSMKSTDFELCTQVALSISPTWVIVPANSLAAGQRRRFVDLAGVIVPGVYQIAIAPSGADKINGQNSPVYMSLRFSYIVLETDGVANWTVVEIGPELQASNNLSDLQSPATARANLGLGSAALHPIGDFMWPFLNLSDVQDKVAARNNLGLGFLCILNTVAFGNLDSSSIATASQILDGTPQKLITTDVTWTSKVPLAMTGNGAITWDFNKFINGVLTLAANSSINVINAKAGQSGFVIIKNGSPVKTLGWPASFNWVNTVTTIYGAVNTNNLFEYWVEVGGSSPTIRTRLTQNI